MGIRKTDFGNAESILRAKGLSDNLGSLLDAIGNGWDQGRKGLSFQKEVLAKHGWQSEKLIGIPARRFAYDGFKNGAAIEIEWNQSEKVLADLLKLQYGFRSGMIDVGIIVNRGDRSKHSPIPESQSGGEKEVDEMRGIITIPVLLVVFYREA